MSPTTKSRIPRRPPRRHRTTIKPPLPPDPAITPTTMKGNYPSRERGTEHTIGLSTGRETRQPSYTPYTKSSPRPEPPRPPERPGWSSARKDYNQPPTFWQRMLAYVLRFIDWLNGLGESFGERHPRPRPLIPGDDKRKGMSRTRLFSQFRFHGDVFTLLAYDPVKDQYSATCSSDSQKYYFSYRFFDTDLDWVNDGEQMATLAELFDEVERPRPPPLRQNPGYSQSSER